jgi:cation transport protein ChaC
MSWVFGYGSLMWRPGFPFIERYPAVLHGWHRAFCRYSLRHRGTEQVPGMVVGLEPGGQCRGYAYWVDPEREAEVLGYLDDREGTGYQRRQLALDIERAGGSAPDEAWVYVPDEQHQSHATGLDRSRIVQFIAQGQGQSGTAHNYLVALVQELERMGAPDPDFTALLREVEAYKREHPAIADPNRPRSPAAAAS